MLFSVYILLSCNVNIRNLTLVVNLVLLDPKIICLYHNYALSFFFPLINVFQIIIINYCIPINSTYYQCYITNNVTQPCNILK